VRSLALAITLVLVGCTSSPAPDDGGTDAATDGASVDAGPIDANLDAWRDYVPTPFTPTPSTIAYCQGHDDAMIEAQITELLARLTLDEKISMMHGAVAALVDGTWLVPGVPRLGIPGLHMLDGPRGVSLFTHLHSTAWPVGMMRGATWDPALEARVGAAMGVEHRSAGADVILAPTINLLRHPRWGRAQETYGEDSHLLGEMGLGFVQGVQSEHVLASVKHFAANSIENTRHTVNVTMDERTLREVYTPHFRRVIIDGHAGTVMSAYNQLNGLYCDEQAHLLTDLLRTEWGFAGLVESDWVFGTHADVASVRAGLNVEMPVAVRFRNLHDAVVNGTIDEHELDQRVREILRVELCFDLASVPRTPGTAIDDPTQRETPEHLALAREVARRGIVLLRNETPSGAAAPALPLDGAVHTIALLGRNADVPNIGDHGSSDVTPSHVVTALEGLSARSGVTVHAIAGTTLDAAAMATLTASDVAVIVTGMQASDEGEAEIGAGDRDSLALPPGELALIHAVAAAHPRVVVVLEGGAAILTSSWESEVEAILFAFYPGEEGGHALADVLFGDVAPSGRLPFSIPAAESDLPPFDNTSATVHYEYLAGYRWLEAMHTAPSYPFGFGLSYTTFSYANLRSAAATIHPGDEVTLTVAVTNEGAVAATDVVQLYAAAVGSSVMRAPEDLRAFQAVALMPHETRDVTLTLRADDLRYWDEASSAWVLEPIDYELRVGAHAGDARLTTTLRAP
jgi:beta-glucosidase